MMTLYRLVAAVGAALVVPALYARSAADPASRAALRQRLGRVPGGWGAGRAVWLHAVSVGEVGVAETFLRAAGAAFPHLSVAVSSTTTSGLERARRLSPGAFAFPLDAPRFVRRALDAIRPAAYGSVETEIWPVLLAECARRGIPAFIVNGTVSARSAARYRWMAGAVRAGLAAVRAACMQTEADASRIVALGAPAGAVVVTGNIKFDAPPRDLADARESLRRILGLEAGVPVMIAGSTSAGEEEIVARAWLRARAAAPGLTLVVAPRHRERFDEAEAALAAAGARVLRRTRASGRPPEAGEAILLDTIGELEAAYGLAQVAFVGGSLVPRGGQSPIEPARAGVPVMFGPGMQSFREVAEALVACGGAFVVRDAASLAERTAALLGDGRARERAGAAARALVDRHRGATERTLRGLAALIPEVFLSDPAPRAAPLPASAAREA